MSVVFTCGCGRRTTEPFIIRDIRYCTICAEQINPEIVDRRERSNFRKFGRQRRGLDGHGYDFGKHSSR